MKGKTVVITGGTSGIGEIAAERLAQMGARIVLIARDKSRGKVTLARLHEKAPDLAHTVHYADLTRISEMKRVAAEIASQEPRIDVLINNAGGQCHAASGLRSRWRFCSQGDEENQLSRLPLSARDHPAGDLALSPVHPKPT